MLTTDAQSNTDVYFQIDGEDELHCLG